MPNVCQIDGTAASRRARRGDLDEWLVLARAVPAAMQGKPHSAGIFLTTDSLLMGARMTSASDDLWCITGGGNLRRPWPLRLSRNGPASNASTPLKGR